VAARGELACLCDGECVSGGGFGGYGCHDNGNSSYSNLAGQVGTSQKGSKACYLLVDRSLPREGAPQLTPQQQPTRVDTRVVPNPDLDTYDVTFTLDGGSFGYVMRMDPLLRDDGSLDPVCVGIGIEQPANDRKPINQTAVRELADRYNQLERAARSAVELATGTGARVSAPVRTRRELSPEFLGDIVRRHDDYRKQGLPPTATLARAEHVSDGTVKHWLRKATDAGIEA
jgi:hypothetical protein